LDTEVETLIHSIKLESWN